MSHETDEPRTDDFDHSHFEGGPVKTFLEHLEDLRWVLIKSLAAIGIAFTVCLLAGPQVIAVVKYPLTRAKLKHPSNARFVSFSLGTNRLGTYRITAEQAGFLPVGTNQFSSFELGLAPNGSNFVVTMTPKQIQPEQVDALNMGIETIGPVDAFMVATKVAIYGGLILASPFVFYFVAAFVFPALKMTERKYTYRGLFFGGGLFIIGVSFCYFILMPIALSASVQFSEWLGFGSSFWRADGYISFVCKFMLGMGLGFELPVVILILVKLGVLNYSMLSRGRRYMIVISFILGAVLTTPEVVTQVLMAMPLLLLYEVTIWIAWYWERQDRKREMAGQQQVSESA